VAAGQVSISRRESGRLERLQNLVLKWIQKHPTSVNKYERGDVTVQKTMFYAASTTFKPD